MTVSPPLDLARKATRGALVTVGGQWSRFVTQFVNAVVMAHLLPPSDFGLVVMVTSLAGIAQILGDFGFGTATLQAAEVSRAQRSNIFWLNVTLGTIFASGVFLLASPISTLYHNAQVASVTQAVAPIFLINAASNQFRSELSRQLRFHWVSLAEFAGQLSSLIVGVILAVLGAGYWALVAQTVALPVVTLGVVVAASDFVPALPNRANIGTLFRFGRDNMIVQIITYVCQNIDTVLLGKYKGSVVAGVYGKAYQLIMLPLFQILAPLSRVAIASLSRVSEPKQFQSYAERLYLVISYVLVGVLAVFGAIVFPFVHILLGAPWDGASRIILVMLLGGVFETLNYPCTWIFLSRGRAKELLRATLATRPVMVLLIVLAAPRGAIPVSIAVAIGFVLNWLAFTFWGLPRIGIAVVPILRIVARPFSFFLVMLAVVSPLAWGSGLWTQPWLQLLLVLTCVVVYNTIGYATLPFLRADVRGILTVFRRRTGNRGAHRRRT